MINRFYLPVLLVLVSFSGLFAQKRPVSLAPAASLTVENPSISSTAGNEMDLAPRNVVDTLVPGAFNDVCGAVQVLYEPAEGWGFISGTNSFGDKEKAQLIRNTTNTTVVLNEVWALFGYVSPVGNGNLRMKIYDVDPDNGSPGSLVAQTNDVRVEAIQYDDASVLATPFSFPLAVDIDLPAFYLSLDFSSLYNTFDTVAVFHTELGCGFGTEAYDLWSDDQWFSVSESWGGEQTFEINYSLLAIVEFDNPNAVNDPFYQQGSVRLFPATPNPARDRVQLNYALEAPGTVQVDLYSTDGRRLRHLDLGRQPAGRYQEVIETGVLPAGTYVYIIQTDRGRVASRFVLK